MRLTLVRVVILIAFLVWRCGNSMWVLAVDRSRTAGLSSPLLDVGDRVRNGLLIKSPDRPDDVAYHHLQLIWNHVPPDAKGGIRYSSALSRARPKLNLSTVGPDR